MRVRYLPAELARLHERHVLTNNVREPWPNCKEYNVASIALEGDIPRRHSQRVVVVGHFGGGYGQAALGNHAFEVEAHAGMEAHYFLEDVLTTYITLLTW